MGETVDGDVVGICTIVGLFVGILPPSTSVGSFVDPAVGDSIRLEGSVDGARVVGPMSRIEVGAVVSLMEE